MPKLQFEEIESIEPTPQTPNSPSSMEDVLDWRSAEDELDLDAPTIDVNSFFERPPLPPSSPDPPQDRPRPGYDILLTSNTAPKNISSDIDKSHILHTKRRANLARALVASEIPRTHREAMLSSEAASWTRAVEAELEAMKDLKVWSIEIMPGDESLLGTVWVFRKKKDAEGIVVKFKARLCAQGSQQKSGFGFTYAPTGRSTSLRAALIVGLSRGYSIHQMDAKNAFLNGKLEESVYLRPPPGLSVPPGHCLKLHKAIYGLKQAPRVWMEDLGEASHILGIKLTKTKANQLLLNQEHYTQSILDNYKMSDCHTVATPMLANTRLVKCSDADHNSFLQLKINYREALGLLNYLSVSTRPDISFTVSQLSQHLEKPGMTHWKAVLHLLRYLAGTKDHGILLDGSGDLNDIAVYTDADFANCTDDRRSYSGYVTLLGGNLLSWRSKKQQTVSTSTTEAEYRALFEGVQESVWLKYLFNVNFQGTKSVYHWHKYGNNDN
ncbi:hypothetical protein MJO28_012736 [Puccinia striiformis f. sp. tritici]|uniref:Uncharacterized protein n=1 Tax=Puccinia striiformis f. sp. tritici TaxID=168172 RepID=A0ACC0E2C6_9BASI|nr:hypothetical protein MJO28_012736 [Puccinia striiformis f. sp. tritici]